jgi:hypothetical protein
MRFSALWWSDAAWSMALAAAGLEWCRLTVMRPSVASRAWRALLTDPMRERRLK